MIQKNVTRGLKCLSVAVAAILAVSCGENVTDEPSGNLGKGINDAFEQGESEPADVAGPNEPTTEQAAGPSSAAFAGCPLTWQDFPESLRPDSGGSGEQVPGDPSEGYEEACQYDHPDGTTYRDPKPAQKPYFGVRVYLGKSITLSAEPGSKESSWAGAPGYTKQVDRNGADVCVAAVALTDGGAGGIAVIAQNWPKPVDTCAVADQLMATLTS